MANDFHSLLKTSTRPLLADGAMGTMLNAQGIDFEHCFDALNLSNPAVVRQVHLAYVDAGAQILLTNTFGANRFKLAAHGLEGHLAEINRAGVDLARNAAHESGAAVLVAGDVGPLGVRLAPFGRVSAGLAEEAFFEQIKALAEAGADLIVIETIPALQEARAAIAAARRACGLPVVATITFTRDDRTLLGELPPQVAETLTQAGADVIGVNCSGGPTQILRILREMRAAAPEAVYAVKPNAGFPEQVGGRIMYPASPEYFGNYAVAFAQGGARLIGGCCGTTPEHIQAMRAALEAAPPAAAVSKGAVPRPAPAPPGPAQGHRSRLAARLAGGAFALAVELQPPRGLSTHRVLAAASLLAESGVDVVNVADNPMARMRMSPWAVCRLIQDQVGVETTLHFPTRGRNLLRVQGDLLAAHALGVRNIFVVMGDPTSIGDYPDAMDDYDLAPSGLIQLIKGGFNLGVDHAGADIDQPTSFYVGAALNLTPRNIEREIQILHRKIDSGADFFLSQPVYEPERVEAFLSQYQDRYGPLKHPVLAGILPLNNPRHAAFLHDEVPGIHIDEETRWRLEAAGDDAPREGVRLALEIIEKIKPWVSGAYLIPAFSRYDLLAEIVDALI